MSIPQKFSKLPRATGTAAGPVRPESWNALVDYVEGLEQRLRSMLPQSSGDIVVRDTGGGYTLALKRRPSSNPRALPFECQLIDREGQLYITVADGCVNERVPGGEDSATIAHECENIRLGKKAIAPETPETRTEFPIQPGQQVSVVVDVDPEGAIRGTSPEDPVRVVIEPVNQVNSVHYVPPIGDDTSGKFGEYHYKLATLEPVPDAEDAWQLKRWLAGSHISHFRELPILANTYDTGSTGIGRIVKEYAEPTNRYLFRGISGVSGQIVITEMDDTVQIGIDPQYTDDVTDGTGGGGSTTGGNLNLAIWPLYYANDGTVYAQEDSEPVIHYFRNGLFVGIEDPADAPESLITSQATWLISAP
jgi:hypothetical protein